MRTLFAIMMLVSCSAIMADGHTLYDHYGYGSRYSNPRVVYPDNVQLHIMQQQSDETDDLLIAAELALTEDDINEIEAEYNSAAREQAEQQKYHQGYSGLP